MYRLRTVFSIFVAIIVLSGKNFAQDPLEVKQQFGKRAAMIPQSPADTGFLYDEVRLEQAAHDHFNSARFSGVNEGKTLHQIETESFNAIRSMQNKAAFKEQSSSAWQPIASSQDGHVSGRVRGITFDAADPKIVYIAAASGGIWKTNNIDARPVQWLNLSDRLPTCNFGSIAADPKRPGVIYAGTGESEPDNYREQISPQASGGLGIFKSVDGGLNWDTVATTAFEGTVCSQIVIDPINSDNIYVATGGVNILKSTDAGGSWKKVPGVGNKALSIAIDPVSPNKLYVSGLGSIYRSVDNGDTWIKCVTGLPTNGSRITLALAPSATNTIYASIGNGSTGGTLGIWVTDDFGVTWRKTTLASTTANPLGMQQSWCNSIVVHPTTPKRIFVAGLDVYQSTDSGKTLSYLSQWGVASSSGNFVHADQHFMTFTGTTLYVCCDGGIAKAQAPFSSWSTDINLGIGTLQFVGVDANKEFTYVTGGCQDNGTNRAWPSSPEFHETIGGDGGHAWVSQEQGNIAYTTYVNTNFKQSLDSAKTWGPNLITAGSGLAKDGSPFYTVYDCNGDGSVVAIGGNTYVWVSTSGGIDAFPLKSNLSIGRSWAIHVATADPTGSIIWAANSGSTMFYTIDQGVTWVKTAKPLASTITGIVSNPTNASELYACTTVGGTNKNVWKSTDGGVTFTNPATNLPNIPCWAITMHPTDGRLFLGTEKGVLWSNDGGVTWYPLMTGLPYVHVTQLRVRGTNNDKLLAGTYGRGMFWVDLSTVGVKSETNANEPLSLDPVYPNPLTSENATVGFMMKDAGLTTITIHDLLGRELRILEKSYFDAGHHQSSFTSAGFSKGTYFVMLTANGRSVSQKVTLN